MFPLPEDAEALSLGLERWADGTWPGAQQKY